MLWNRDLMSLSSLPQTEKDNLGEKKKNFFEREDVMF